MNILLITPGIDKRYNDNYFVYKELSSHAHSLTAISQRDHVNKGKGSQKVDQFEIDDNITINRVFRDLKSFKSLKEIKRAYKRTIKKTIEGINPDIILAEEVYSFYLAYLIKKDFNIPIVLRVEFIFTTTDVYRTMGAFLKKFQTPITRSFLPKLIGSFIWKHICIRIDSVISCYPIRDDERINTYGKPCFYIPWPSALPDTFNELSLNVVKSNQGVFIGAFDRHKNMNELARTLPYIFERTQIERFIIVGDGENFSTLSKLKLDYPNKIVHLQSLPRNSCLELIKSSFFAYSPAVRGGWGFIGDAFACGTPLIVTKNHYSFNDGVDSIVTSPDMIACRINNLVSSQKLYEEIAVNAYRRYEDFHSAVGVANQYLEAINVTIKQANIKA